MRDSAVYTVCIGGFFQLLCLLFISLKLTNNIDWSWLLVLSPLWLPIVVVLAVTAFVLSVVAIVSLVKIVCGRA